MSEHDILYFRNLWQENVFNLENHCKAWETICSDCSIPEDVHGEIRTVIGLTKLLMNQKLEQFKGLIDDSEFHTGEKEITCTDLEGFWDMVFYEVEKIEKSFERLSNCKNNEWNFLEEVIEKPIKKAPVKKDISAINKKKEVSKTQMLAARQRIAEIKKKMAQKREDRDENQVDILLPNKKELAKENTNDGVVMNTDALDDKTVANESNEKEKVKHKVSNKQNMLSELKDPKGNASKQKSAQKKKHAASNKENLCSDNNSSNLKHTPAKQAKFKELIQEQENATNKPGFVKLQCVTRSAAKKALLFQQK